MKTNSFERHGAQDLHTLTMREQRDDCEQCHQLTFGQWYRDDREGGSEWFLCRGCVENIRRHRDELERREEGKI